MTFYGPPQIRNTEQVKIQKENLKKIKKLRPWRFRTNLDVAVFHSR